MIKYIGSKRLLVPHILGIVGALPDVRSVFDVFSGTARVGHALKRAGYRVTANDHNRYASTLARCYVQADRDRLHAVAAQRIAELARVPPQPGYFTETFCERARFFHPRNGGRIDAMRERIADWQLEPELEAVLLTALMEAADRVDSTTGVQMAYLKQWAPRALSDLELRLPDLLPGPGLALEEDALAVAPRISADLAYVDPPYNQHSYLGNYHIWESLVRWDKPPVYGRACKRVQCRDYRSPFNSRPRIRGALAQLVRDLDAHYLLVSFSDEGFVSGPEILEMLSVRGEVQVIEVESPRYVGAKIGIYNPAGCKVGRIGRLRNTERLFLAGGRRAGCSSGNRKRRSGCPSGNWMSESHQEAGPGDVRTTREGEPHERVAGDGAGDRRLDPAAGGDPAAVGYPHLNEPQLPGGSRP